MPSLHLTTSHGQIRLLLRPDLAPATVAHVLSLAKLPVFSTASFYRSDFVLQFGLHHSGHASPLPPLTVNESALPGRLSNSRGAVAVAHWDVPDCGNSECFISLKDNSHLDKAYGGYCVFATVALDDKESWATIDALNKLVLGGGRGAMQTVAVVP